MNRRCYSAYELSTLKAISSQHVSVSSSQASQFPSLGIPLDISIETIFSVVFICVGLVLGAEELKPVSWRVWAGKAERESEGGGLFQGLEHRLGFVDIRVGSHATNRTCIHSSLRVYTVDVDCRIGANVFESTQAKRKDFADWVRDQGNDIKR